MKKQNGFKMDNIEIFLLSQWDLDIKQVQPTKPRKKN